MSVIIGGSGSSGSTLLRSLLDRHTEIFCGSETALLNKSSLYLNWEKNKYKIIDKPLKLKTDQWFPYPGVFLDNDDYYYNNRNLRTDLEKSKTLVEFLNKFYEPSLNKFNKKIWVEKTPSNAYCFLEFLNMFSVSGKVIHIVRNPYDCVSSMVARGMSEYFAAGVYLYNNSKALKASKSNSYCLVKYEDLISNPNEVLNKIFSFLEVKSISYHDLLNVNGRHLKKEEKNTWQSRPDGKITNNKSRFKKLSTHHQDRILSALTMFKGYSDNDFVPFEDQMDLFQYDLLKPISCKKSLIHKQHNLVNIWRFLKSHKNTNLDKKPT